MLPYLLLLKSFCQPVNSILVKICDVSILVCVFACNHFVELSHLCLVLIWSMSLFFVACVHMSSYHFAEVCKWWKLCRHQSAYGSSALGRAVAESIALVPLSRDMFESIILGMFLCSRCFWLTFQHTVLISAKTRATGGSVVLGHHTCDQEVASSTPGRSIAG